MGNYEELLNLLHAESQRWSRRRSAAGAAAALRDLAPPEKLEKALSDFTRSVRAITPKPAKPTPRPSPRVALPGIMAKALAAYQAGQISADQLCVLEARRHRLVNTMAQRGVL